MASFFSVDFSYLSAAALGVKQTSVFWGIFSVDFSQRVSRTKKQHPIVPLLVKRGPELAQDCPVQLLFSCAMQYSPVEGFTFSNYKMIFYHEMGQSLDNRTVIR